MVDQFVGVIAYMVASLGGGFLSSWMSFNASGEPFDPRKHGNALITGTLMGLGLSIGTLALDAFDQMNNAMFALFIFGVFWTAFGVDRARASGSKMSARNALEMVQKFLTNKPTNTEPTPT